MYNSVIKDINLRSAECVCSTMDFVCADKQIN